MSHSTRKPKCPACHQEVVKKSDGQCVVCQSCSKEKRCIFRFCWDCQREWPKTTSAYSACNQPNCALRAALLSDKRISNANSSAQGCPYFRACPNCNALLTHNGQGCPKINCPKCFTAFCFRCLRPRCIRTDFYLIDFELLSHRFNNVQECTIVDNSQSLMALH
ncbi:hypothetical protein Q7C36_022846 [Tachysurus vachellii]|uniref:RING-type domain-containing protein n=1 Tax=Tachysurus vachellii TaxID=175792 RepID=A0AA88IM87_TACVA|nr:hypothetical protein Q7C36_022846 [Tachysurus vachellii]